MKRLFLVSLGLAGTLAYAAAATPAPTKWEAAVVTTVSAVGDSTGFTIIANVQLPQPKACYDVTVKWVPTFVPPTRYEVQQRHNGHFCTTVITPYIVKQHFAAKPWPKSLDVYALDVQNKPMHWKLSIIVH
jgi:hypothetical protein